MRSRWTPIPPCTRSMANKWVPAKVITPRIGGRRVFNRSSPLWRRRGSIYGASCATAIGPMGSRSQVIWQGSSPPCPSASRRSTREWMRAFMGGEAIEAYEKGKAHFIMVARKTSRLLEQLGGGRWKPSPKTDADEQCEFWYQPEGWGKAYRFIALRYKKKEKTAEEHEQYQLFDSPEYNYRVFVTNMEEAIDLLVWFYNQRAGAENLIKEANNDAGLAAHPSGRWATNCVHFQLAMLAYNLNCWLMLFNREEQAKLEELKHTTLATARLRFLFVAARIWKHSGRVGISYSDQYQEKGMFQRLMGRLRGIAFGLGNFLPVLATSLAS